MVEVDIRDKKVEKFMKILEKIERKLGEKLLLKGERCAGPKCALVRRNYPPGIHGKKKRRRLSEYGQILLGKQKLRFYYNLDDREVERYSKKATKASGLFVSNLLKLIEKRLDNVVLKLGLASSRRSARQLINHGHITVNGKTVTIPSYQVKKDDVIAVKESSLGKSIFADLEDRIKKYEPPSWLKLDKSKKSGIITGSPTDEEEKGLKFDLPKIKELYSR